MLPTPRIEAEFLHFIGIQQPLPQLYFRSLAFLAWRAELPRAVVGDRLDFTRGFVLLQAHEKAMHEQHGEQPLQVLHPRGERAEERHDGGRLLFGDDPLKERALDDVGDQRSAIRIVARPQLRRITRLVVRTIQHAHTVRTHNGHEAMHARQEYLMIALLHTSPAAHEKVSQGVLQPRALLIIARVLHVALQHKGTQRNTKEHR